MLVNGQEKTNKSSWTQKNSSGRSPLVTSSPLLMSAKRALTPVGSDFAAGASAKRPGGGGGGGGGGPPAAAAGLGAAKKRTRCKSLESGSRSKALTFYQK